MIYEKAIFSQYLPGSDSISETNLVGKFPHSNNGSGNKKITISIQICTVIMITFHHKLPVSMFSNMSPSQTMSTRTCRVNSPMYMLEMVNGIFPHYQIDIFKLSCTYPDIIFSKVCFPGFKDPASTALSHLVRMNSSSLLSPNAPHSVLMIMSVGPSLTSEMVSIAFRSSKQHAFVPVPRINPILHFSKM